MMLRSVCGAAVLCGALVACVRTETTRVEVTPDPMRGDSLKPATNLPAAFTVLIAPSTPGDCPTRLRDAGLGTTLTLQRSTMRAAPDSTGAFRAFGDYSAEPIGRYGEVAGEGLRVDCTRLRALGVVAL
jgi:hypothetical protein